MTIEIAALARSLRTAQSAAELAASASSRELPWLFFGRGKAIEAIRGDLVQAADQAMEAVSVLRSVWATSDVELAARELSRQARALAQSPRMLEGRAGAPFLDAIELLRTRASDGRVVKLERAATSGADDAIVNSLTKRLTAVGVTANTRIEAVLLADDPDAARIIDIARHLDAHHILTVYPLHVARTLSHEADPMLVLSLNAQLLKRGVSVGTEDVIALARRPDAKVVVDLLGVIAKSGVDARVAFDQARILAGAPDLPDVVSLAKQLREHGQHPATSFMLARELRNVGVPTDAILGALSKSDVPSAIAAEVKATLNTKSIGELGALIGGHEPGRLARCKAMLEALSKRLAETTPTDDADARMLETLHQLVDDNLARMTGTLQDGYSVHPDYGELGRISAITQLRELRSSIPAASPMATANLLTW